MGHTLDSRIAWSSSSTHDAVRSALSVLTLVEPIFESIFEEMSWEAALRGKWEGTGKAMCIAYWVHWQHGHWGSTNPNASGPASRGVTKPTYDWT